MNGTISLNDTILSNATAIEAQRQPGLLPGWVALVANMFDEYFYYALGPEAKQLMQEVDTNETKYREQCFDRSDCSQNHCCCQAYIAQRDDAVMLFRCLDLPVVSTSF